MQTRNEEIETRWNFDEYRELIAKGDSLKEQKKYSDALTEYQKAIANCSYLPNAYIAAADVHFIKNEHQLALKFYIKAEEHSPQNITATTGQIKIYESKKTKNSIYKNAKKRHEQNLKLAEQFKHGYFQTALVIIWIARQNDKTALQLMAADENNIDGTLVNHGYLESQMGLIAYNDNKRDVTIFHLQNAIKAFSHDVKSAAFLARMYFNIDSCHDIALDILKNIIQNYGTLGNRLALYIRAEIYDFANLEDRGKQDYLDLLIQADEGILTKIKPKAMKEKIISIISGNPEYLTTGSLKLNPEDEEKLISINNALNRTDATETEWLEIIETLNRIIHLQPDVATHYEKIALAYRKLGKTKEARVNFSIAIWLAYADDNLNYQAELENQRTFTLRRTDFSSYKEKLATANKLMIEKNYPDALQTYKNAIINDCHYLPNAYIGAANVLMAQNNFLEALCFYKHATSLSVNNVMAMKGMAKCYEKLNNMPKALAMIKLCQDIHKDQKTLFKIHHKQICSNTECASDHDNGAFSEYYLAIQFFNSKQYNAAIFCFQNAIEKLNEDTMAKIMLAQTYAYYTNKVTEAKDIVNKVIAQYSDDADAILLRAQISFCHNEGDCGKQDYLNLLEIALTKNIPELYDSQNVDNIILSINDNEPPTLNQTPQQKTGIQKKLVRIDKLFKKSDSEGNLEDADCDTILKTIAEVIKIEPNIAEHYKKKAQALQLKHEYKAAYTNCAIAYWLVNISNEKKLLKQLDIMLAQLSEQLKTPTLKESRWDFSTYRALLTEGNALMQQGLYSAAADKYNAAITDCDYLPHAYIALGEAYEKQENPQQALESYTTACQKSPKCLLALEKQAIMHAELNQTAKHEAAHNAYNVMCLDKDRVEFRNRYFRRLRNHFDPKKHTAAKELFAVDIENAFLEWLEKAINENYLGHLAYKSGNNSIAIFHFQEALILFEHDLFAMDTLSQLYQLNRETHDKMLELSDKMNFLFEKWAAPYLRKAQHFYNTNTEDFGKKCFLRTLELADKNFLHSIKRNNALVVVILCAIRDKIDTHNPTKAMIANFQSKFNVVNSILKKDSISPDEQKKIIECMDFIIQKQLINVQQYETISIRYEVRANAYEALGKFQKAYNDLLLAMLTTSLNNINRENNLADKRQAVFKKLHASKEQQTNIPEPIDFLDVFITYRKLCEHGKIDFATRHYDDAIEIFNEAIQQCDNIAEAYSAMGDAYEAKRNFKEADENYQLALNLLPGDPATLLKRKNNYLKIDKKSPRDEEYITLCESYQTAKLAEEQFFAFYFKLLKKYLVNAPNPSVAALAVLNARDYSELNLLNGSMHFAHLGTIAQQLNNPRVAIYYFQRALDKFSDDPYSAHNLALLLHETKNSSDEDTFATCQLNMDRYNYSLSHLFMGMLKQKKHKLEAAKDHFYFGLTVIDNEQLNQFKKHTKQIINILYATDKYTVFSQQEKHLKLQSYIASAQENLAKENYPLAAIQYVYAIELNPYSPLLHAQLGLITEKIEKYDEALFHYALAMLLDNQKDLKSSYNNFWQIRNTLFEKINSLEPDHPFTNDQNNLFYQWMQSEFQRYRVSPLNFENNSAEEIDERCSEDLIMAYYLYRCKKYDYAISYCNSALQQMEHNFVIITIRGFFHLAAGNSVAAENDFHTAINKHQYFLAAWGLAEIARNKQDLTAAKQYYSDCITRSIKPAISLFDMTSDILNIVKPVDPMATDIQPNSDLGAAKLAISKTIWTNPDIYFNYYDRSRLNLLTNQVIDAMRDIEYFDEVARANNVDPKSQIDEWLNICYDLGNKYFNKGDFKLSLDFFNAGCAIEQSERFNDAATKAKEAFKAANPSVDENKQNDSKPVKVAFKAKHKPKPTVVEADIDEAPPVIEVDVNEALSIDPKLLKFISRETSFIPRTRKRRKPYKPHYHKSEHQPLFEYDWVTPCPLATNVDTEIKTADRSPVVSTDASSLSPSPLLSSTSSEDFNPSHDDTEFKADINTDTDIDNETETPDLAMLHNLFLPATKVKLLPIESSFFINLKWFSTEETPIFAYAVGSSVFDRALKIFYEKLQSLNTTYPVSVIATNLANLPVLSGTKIITNLSLQNIVTVITRITQKPYVELTKHINPLVKSFIHEGNKIDILHVENLTDINLEEIANSFTFRELFVPPDGILLDPSKRAIKDLILQRLATVKKPAITYRNHISAFFSALFEQTMRGLTIPSYDEIKEFIQYLTNFTRDQNLLSLELFHEINFEMKRLFSLNKVMINYKKLLEWNMFNILFSEKFHDHLLNSHESPWILNKLEQSNARTFPRLEQIYAIFIVSIAMQKYNEPTQDNFESPNVLLLKNCHLYEKYQDLDSDIANGDFTVEDKIALQHCKDIIYRFMLFTAAFEHISFGLLVSMLTSYINEWKTDHAPASAAPMIRYVQTPQLMWPVNNFVVQQPPIDRTNQYQP